MFFTPAESIYVGVDPGRKGAMCLLPYYRDGSPHFIDFEDLDIVEVTKKLQYLQPWIKGVAVEQVRSLPGMSARSNFSFGYAVGQIETILTAASLPFTRVLPKAWQSTCEIEYPKGRTSRQRKLITARRALTLYPNVRLYGPRGGLKDGRADALLIAHYLQQQEGSNEHSF